MKNHKITVKNQGKYFDVSSVIIKAVAFRANFSLNAKILLKNRFKTWYHIFVWLKCLLWLRVIIKYLVSRMAYTCQKCRQSFGADKKRYRNHRYYCMRKIADENQEVIPIPDIDVDEVAC